MMSRNFSEDGQSVQDPFGFSPSNSDLDEHSRGSRPRSGSSTMKEKLQNKIKAKHKSFKDELDDIVHKAANFIEKNFGKNLLFNRTTFDGEESEEEICDPESMQKTQNKCIVSTKYRVFHLKNYKKRDMYSSETVHV